MALLLPHPLQTGHKIPYLSPQAIPSTFCCYKVFVPFQASTLVPHPGEFGIGIVTALSSSSTCSLPMGGHSNRRQFLENLPVFGKFPPTQSLKAHHLFTQGIKVMYTIHCLKQILTQIMFFHRPTAGVVVCLFLVLNAPHRYTEKSKTVPDVSPTHRGIKCLLPGTIYTQLY